jgi:hypothetical protein
VIFVILPDMTLVRSRTEINIKVSPNLFLTIVSGR